MTKELVIEMPEECVDCPNLELELETETLMYFESKPVKIHQCTHMYFCKKVVKNLQDHGWKSEVKE